MRMCFSFFFFLLYFFFSLFGVQHRVYPFAIAIVYHPAVAFYFLSRFIFYRIYFLRSLNKWFYNVI